MIFGKLSGPRQWEPFAQSLMLEQSFRWISAKAHSSNEGIFELGEPGWFVNVHSYSTQPRAQCTWENHPQTVDLQYIMEGVEGIDLTEVDLLGEPTLFKVESDTQKFAHNDRPATQLILQADAFALLLPGEAHRPKIAVEEPSFVRKLVVKIPLKLL